MSIKEKMVHALGGVTADEHDKRMKSQSAMYDYAARKRDQENRMLQFKVERYENLVDILSGDFNRSSEENWKVEWMVFTRTVSRVVLETSQPESDFHMNYMKESVANALARKYVENLPEPDVSYDREANVKRYHWKIPVLVRKGKGDTV